MNPFSQIPYKDSDEVNEPEDEPFSQIHGIPAKTVVIRAQTDGLTDYALSRIDNASYSFGYGAINYISTHQSPGPGFKGAQYSSRHGGDFGIRASGFIVKFAEKSSGGTIVRATGEIIDMKGEMKAHLYDGDIIELGRNLEGNTSQRYGHFA